MPQPQLMIVIPAEGPVEKVGIASSLHSSQ